jgi:predicted nucleic acid-binding protein
VEELGELVREERARMIGLIRQELLAGIKTGEQFEKLRATLRAFPDEPLETSDYEAAAKSSNRCRTKGIVVSIVDILICSVAIARGWSVFTTDPEFQIYARVLPVELHRGRR